jgi:hypothetical protein
LFSIIIFEDRLHAVADIPERFSYKFSKLVGVGVGVGVGVEVGVGVGEIEGIAEGLGVEMGVGDSVGEVIGVGVIPIDGVIDCFDTIFTATPLLQTNFFPLFMQAKVFP